MKTNHPINNIIRKRKMSGRMAKWYVQLCTYDLRYEPRPIIKSQVLANFMVDLCPVLQHEV